MSERTAVRLAVQGGTPVRTEPLPPGYPGGLLIGEEEKAAVLEVLDSQSLFRHYGPRPLHKVAQFERAFALAMDARHAVGVSSGTAALMTALAALGAGPGDEVIVPTYTWVATINAVVSLGAVPVFVDIDDTLTLDPSKIDAAVTPRSKVLLPVHMRGAGSGRPVSGPAVGYPGRPGRLQPPVPQGHHDRRGRDRCDRRHQTVGAGRPVP